MKKTTKRILSAALSTMLCVCLLLQLPGVALAFTPNPKWDFMQIAIANTGEVLSESNSYYQTDTLTRAYNPYTERATLSFVVPNTQPYSVDIYERNGSDGLYSADPRGEFVGYISGTYESDETVFNPDKGQYFKGYGGLLQELADVPVEDPFDEINGTNFINTITWDGEVVDGGGSPVTLADNTEYVIALQPLTENEEDNRAYLAVKIDRTLPPKGLGLPVGASAPFSALSSLPGQHNINMVTGNYIYSNVDLAVAGAQLLAFTRTYNSTDGYSGILGANWRTNYDYSLEESGLSVRVYMPDGTRYDFSENYDGTYTAPEASNLTLVKSGSGFTMTDRSKTQYEFDAQGQITKITTLGGFETTFTYGAYGPETITSKNGNASSTSPTLTLTISYNGNGRISGITASCGGASADDKRVSYEYDLSGNLTAFINPQGQRFTYTYTGDNKLATFTDGNERLCIVLNYDMHGRVASANIGGSASACTLTYDLETRTTTATDATDKVYTYHYDRDRDVTSVTKLSGTQYYEYKDGRVISETSPEGNTTHYTFDERGNMTSTTRPDGSGSRITYNSDNLPALVETLNMSGTTVSSASYTYDAQGNIITQTDKAGNVTTYTYDYDNNCLSSSTNGKTTNFTYTDGRLTDVATPDGGGVTRTYNAQGKVTSETTKLNNTTYYEYDDNGYLEKMTDPLGNVTEYVVDANGRVTAEIGPEIEVGGEPTRYRTEWTYDNMGNVLTQKDPLGRITEYKYDSMGRMLDEIDPLDGKISYGYDDDGRVLSMTDARGSTWTYDYDADNRQTGLTDPYGKSFTASYDENGNMTSSTDPRNATTSFKYDTDWRVVEVKDALDDPGIRSFGYDGNGNVISATDENGNEWEYTYDDNNNITLAEDPLGNDTAYTYDGAGRLTIIETALGITQKFTYDLDGRLAKSEDGEGKTTKYIYDAMARLINVEYADYTTIAYEYDALGRMTKYIDALGNETLYGYDAAGQITKHTDALGNETKYTYDANGNLESVTDALGGATAYTYDENNNVTELKDALKQTLTYKYDDLNRLISAKSANGSETIYAYDVNGNLTTLTKPDGGILAYTYDANNRLATANDGFGTSTLGYDAAGNITSVTDPRSNTTSFTYDKLNRSSSIALPDGGGIAYTYDTDGRVAKVTQKVYDTKTAITEYTYDSNNRITEIKDALGHRRTVAYNAVGQIAAETDENGNESHYAYDRNGNLTKYTDPMGNFTEYGYDKLGRLISETAPRGGYGEDASTTKYTYDELSRVTEITDAMSRKTKLEYDALGRIKTVTDAKGGATRYNYDENGNIVKTADALGNVSTFEYDSMNRLTTATTPGGAVTLYTYDTRGLVKKIVDPARGETTAIYDENGNLMQETDANGNVAEYEYDAMNRVKGIAYGDEKTVTYAYNAAGQLVGLTDWTGTTELQSDLLGQLKKVTDPQGHITEYTWDGAGNRTSLMAPDSPLTSYAYNANNQLTSATTNSETTNYTYYGTTKLRSVTLPNGEDTRYSYDVLGQKVFELHSISGTDVRSYAYKYDELGRLISETRDNIGIGVPPMSQETFEYRYDALDRLTQFKGKGGETTDYTYDATGNLLSEISVLNGTTTSSYIYSYNTKNQLVSKTAPDGAHTFAYDGAGNLLSEALNGDTIKTLEYDATGRFVKGANASGETTEYIYNALGYRVTNTITRTNPNAAYADSANSGGSEYIGSVEDTIDAWNSNDLYTRIDGSGKSRQEEISVEEKNYIPDFTTGGLSDIFISVEGLYDQTLTWGLGLISVETVAAPGSEASVQQTVAAEYNLKAYAHSNRLGGVSYFTDADGELVTYNEFDAWGNAYTGQPEDANYSGLDVLTGFTGYTWDAVLEVYFAQARLYDTGSKRFVQADPVVGSIANPLSLNAYLYCRDDPVDNIDPTGMIMPGDQNLSVQKQAEIAVFTQQWDAANAAGNRAGMDAAHAGAEAVRNRQESSPGSAGNSGNNGNGAYSAAYYQWQQMTAGLPPTNYSILVEEIAKFAPTLTLSEVRKTADEWVSRSNEISQPTRLINLPTNLITAQDTHFETLANSHKVQQIPKQHVESKSIVDSITEGILNVMGKLQAVGCNLFMDDKGIYHAYVDTWQSIFGYNRLFDEAFGLGTSMEAKTLTFSTEDETYRLWMWKGDYWGLGAGAEVGIYTQGILGTWKSGLNDKLDMTLNLYYKDHNNALSNSGNIFRYAPDEPQWWITGFNPNVLGVKAGDLLVTSYIDFSDRPDMWDALREEYVGEQDYKDMLTFDSKTKLLGIRW